MSRPLQTGDTLDFNDFNLTPEGIRYTITKSSDQDKPKFGSLVSVHYSGYLLANGKEVGQKFDSSLDRNQPLEFNVGYKQVIEGWDRTLADMRIGEKRTVILPPEQGYGDRAVSIIPANAWLIFEIELLEVH